MKRHAAIFCVWLLFVGLGPSLALAQEVKASHSEGGWQLSGLIQLQYLVNPDIGGDEARTNNGFRIRRGRLQAKGKVTDWVSTNFQIEVRDNSPRLKDAEGAIHFSDYVRLRLGQFKVPVWREELRSSKHLFLIERSATAAFLEELNLSARQIGFEFRYERPGGLYGAVNISNGAGEGVREDAGTLKSREFVNNGKLVTGRFNVPVKDHLQVALSAVVNNAGSKIEASNNTGTIYAIAPDFFLHFPVGSNDALDVEGGVILGGISSRLSGAAGSGDHHFNLFDVTGRWKAQLARPRTDFGGLDAVEFAAGFTFLEPDTGVKDNEVFIFRFGPGIDFGQQTRMQLNLEVQNPSDPLLDTTVLLRLQGNLIF